MTPKEKKKIMNNIAIFLFGMYTLITLPFVILVIFGIFIYTLMIWPINNKTFKKTYNSKYEPFIKIMYRWFI